MKEDVQSINLLLAITEIKYGFVKAFESAHEVSKILKANMLQYHTHYTDNIGVVKLVVATLDGPLPTATLDGPTTPVGALSSTLAKLQASPKFRKLREAGKSITKHIGPQAHEVTTKVDEYVRGMISVRGSRLFKEHRL
ncbi:unnamed protein product [Lactuca saligna]|uniref:Uncharacterized protein n=1 Tax=Lactuca saligna TaxID=75948 RepID=A0AA35YLW6_LACSI|nr:unnamed protein product [Lactuca saligna]